MYPSLKVHDRTITYKKPYDKTPTQVGDIIEFPSFDLTEEQFRKRVVACAGDTIEVKNNRLIINDIPLELTPVQKVSLQLCDLRDEDPNQPIVNGTIYIEHNGGVSYPIFLADDPNHTDDFKKKTISTGCVFVLGDNRNFSWDSRYFGFVPISKIKGTAKYLFWTGGDWSRWGLIRREPQPAK